MKDRNGSTMKLLNRNVSADKKHIYLKLLTKEEIIRRVESPDSEYKSIFKLALALVYFLLSTYLTCAIMVYVDGRIPDGYPPLPDLFLDNIPPVPYAFEICEFIAVAMTLCWTAVILLHKHRIVILRRTFSLIGSVFIIKCLTMIITSMSVPAHHLICDRNIKGSTNFLDLLQQSFQIWFRVGLTIFGGKRTCGDYMFSGHTATITLLNHLITEYTPSEWKALHITSWGMNIVGMFLILAAHEHYSVDVFIAFYISSRMFLYYHTYAYNHSKFTVTDWRVRLWFPLGWFFEAGGVGRVLNEYKFPWSVRGNSVIDAAQEFKQNGTTKNISEPLVNMEPIILVNNEANGNYRFQMKLLNKEELIKKVESPDTKRKSMIKLVLAFVYCEFVFLLTSIVMTFVDDRVPDVQKYPPLPDIVLSNIPLIPWAFHVCEIIIVTMGIFWLTVLIFHKHKVVIMRRMFALSGTIFLLRCFTMLITSLSVPGIHHECRASKYNTVSEHLYRAFDIWIHMGMSIQGVRVCGDYMFSGHTVTITLLNHFITEYTPPDWHSVHTISWVFNCFGMFFILAGHEHYSLDVLIGFYIASRMFLYYHTCAYNLWNLINTDWRIRIWFPLGWLFEAGGMGKLNNEFELPWLSDVDVDEVSEQSLSEIKETMEKITIQNKKEL